MKSDRADRDRIGLDKWSGQHPIARRRSGSWWKRRIRRVLRRLFNRSES